MRGVQSKSKASLLIRRMAGGAGTEVPGVTPSMAVLHREPRIVATIHMFLFCSLRDSLLVRASRSARCTDARSLKAMHEGYADLQGTGDENEGRAMSASAKALRAWVEFASEDPPQARQQADDMDAEVDAALYEFGGDFRATIRALIHDIAVLAADFCAAVSPGYLRGAARVQNRK